MPTTPGTLYFLSPRLNPHTRRVADMKIRASGGRVAARLTRAVQYVVAPAAECRAAARRVAAGRNASPRHVTIGDLRGLLMGTMVVGLENGLEHVLDLASGRVHSRMPAALEAMPTLPEADVSKESLERVLAAGGIRVTRDSDDDVLAHALGESVNLVINEDRRLVRFLKLVTVDPLIDEFRRQSVVTRLNTEYDLARFRLWNDDGILADYVMSYRQGMVPAQLVELVVKFCWVVKEGLQGDIGAELRG